MKELICQECGGIGEYVDDIISQFDNLIIKYDCPWCHGTGVITAEDRGEWLRLKKELKHEQSM